MIRVENFDGSKQYTGGSLARRAKPTELVSRGGHMRMAEVSRRADEKTHNIYQYILSCLAQSGVSLGNGLCLKSKSITSMLSSPNAKKPGMFARVRLIIRVRRSASRKPQVAGASSMRSTN